MATLRVAAAVVFVLVAGIGWGQEHAKPGKKPGGPKQPTAEKPKPEPAPAIDTTPRRDPIPLAERIDKLIEERLAKEKIPLSPPAADAEFFRRPALDIVGRIPTVEEARRFLESSDPDKRSCWIDELLASPLYGEHFATIWNELIMPPATGLKAGQSSFTPWLAGEFNRNRSWDDLVRELLTVEGKLRELPQTAFVMAASDNGDPKAHLLADATARLFWGVQLRCAECHDHPFAPWKQTDFWGVAAFFSRVRKGYSDGKNPQGWTLTESLPADDVNRTNSSSSAAPDHKGPAILVPETGGKLAGQVVVAKFLAGDEPAWDDVGPYRPRFAAWATSSENPWFAANCANRLWHHFLGRGLVHPLDGFHAESAASHPEVLALLEKELRDTDFDLKHLIRVICHTRAYQRTSRPVPGNEQDVELCSHVAVKTMRPEMLYDSLSLVLSPPMQKSGSPAKQLLRSQPLAGISRVEFGITFGTRPEELEGSIVNSGLPQFLRLLNGPLLNGELPAISRLTKSNLPAEDVIETLYLAAYSRRPSADELKTTTRYVADHPNTTEAYAGLLWALVNSAEFVVNH
jgi:hypothetical protein